MADKNCIILEKLIGYIDKIASYANGLEQSAFLADTKVVEELNANSRTKYIIKHVLR